MITLSSMSDRSEADMCWKAMTEALRERNGKGLCRQGSRCL